MAEKGNEVALAIRFPFLRRFFGRRGDGFRFTRMKSADLVQLASNAGFFAGSIVLMNEALGSRLVDLLYRKLDNLVLVSSIVGNCSINLFQNGLQVGLSRFVVGRFHGVYLLRVFFADLMLGIEHTSLPLHWHTNYYIISLGQLQGISCNSPKEKSWFEGKIQLFIQKRPALPPFSCREEPAKDERLES